MPNVWGLGGHVGAPMSMIEHLVLEFLSADGRELDEQMAIFAERVRPRLA